MVEQNNTSVQLTTTESFDASLKKLSQLELGSVQEQLGGASSGVSGVERLPKKVGGGVRRKEFLIILGLIVLGYGSYNYFLGKNLLYAYHDFRNDNITLDTVICFSVFAGSVYFMVSAICFHVLSSKMRTFAGGVKTDYITFVTKIVLFLIWVQLSRPIVFNETSFDDVESLIILSVFGVPFFFADFILLFVFMFVFNMKKIFNTKTRWGKNL